MKMSRKIQQRRVQRIEIKALTEVVRHSSNAFESFPFIRDRNGEKFEIGI